MIGEGEAGLTCRNRFLNVTLMITFALLALIICMPAMSSAEGYFTSTGNMTFMPTSSGSGIYDVNLPVDGFYVNAPLLYVANNASVYVIDTSTNKVIDAINVSGGNMIWSVAVSPDYSKLYLVYLDGPAYVRGLYETSYIDTIDLKTKNVIRTDYIPAAGRVQRTLMNNDGGRIYILTKYPTADAVYEYDTIDCKFTKVLYFSNLYYHDYAEMFDMALSEDGKRLYLANLNHLCVNVLDTSTFKLDPTTPGYSYGTINYNLTGETSYGYGSEIRFYGIAVNPGGSKIYLSNHYIKPASGGGTCHSSRITVFDLSEYNKNDDSYQKIIETYDDPGRMVVSPDGSYLYAVDSESAAVRGISTQTDQEYRSYGTGESPVDITITPDGSRVYTANYGTDTVTVINAPSLTYCPPGSIKVCLSPYVLFMGKTPAAPVFINTSGSKKNLQLSHVNLSYSSMPKFTYVNHPADANSSTGPLYTLPLRDLPAFTIIPGQSIELPEQNDTAGNNAGENKTVSPAPNVSPEPSAVPSGTPVPSTGDATATPTASTPGPGFITVVLGLVIVAYRENRKP
jgi:YVTN family beta-propeller protein